MISRDLKLTISNNKATLNENVTISHANFTNNWADINGGAIDWYKGAANGRVEHVKFINNTAKRSGGAIYWYGHNGTLYDVTFINNTAPKGACIFAPYSNNVNISKSIFTATAERFWKTVNSTAATTALCRYLKICG